jgi:hypothetical protein
MSAHLHVDSVLNRLSAKTSLPSLPVDSRTRAASGARPGAGMTAGCADVLELSDEQHLRLTDVQGCTVTVLSGELWITQDGDARDLVLGRGEEHVIDRDSPALLSSLGKRVSARFLICRGRQEAGSLKFQPSLA